VGFTKVGDRECVSEGIAAHSAPIIPDATT
jgi:hypothetical protein